MPGKGIARSPFFNRFFGGSAPAFDNIIAAGGTVTYLGGKKTHTFNNTTDFLNFDVFYVPDGVTARRLRVGGGGGGERGNGASGGGAGGVIEDLTWAIPLGSYAVKVGAGGRKGDINLNAANGSSTLFGSETVLGGARGVSTGFAGISGLASGSGGTRGNAGGTGTAGQGNAGGSSVNSSGWGVGGSGGAGQVGQNGTTTLNGKGGDGIQSDISGTATYYGGGGAGGQTSGVLAAGIGGLGGGGNGGTSGVNGQNGTDGLGGGGGGGGGGTVSDGGRGGNGRVIVSYDWEGPEIDYSYFLTELNAAISNVAARDSATYIPLNGTEMFFGFGWTESGLRADCYTTTDGITFTGITDAPIAGSHVTAGLRSDGQMWFWGADITGNIFVLKLNPTTKAWTTVTLDVGGTELPGDFAYWGVFHNDAMYIAMTTSVGVTKLFNSTDGIVWTEVCTLPFGHSENCAAYSDGTNMYYGGGANYDEIGLTISDYNPSIYKSVDGGANWTVNATLPVPIQSAWPTLLRFDGREFMFVGFTNTGFLQDGYVYVREPDAANFSLIGFVPLAGKHAQPACVFGDKLYLACGYYDNDSYSITRLGI